MKRITKKLVSTSLALTLGFTLLLPQVGLAYSSEDDEEYEEEAHSELGEAFQFEGELSPEEEPQMGIQCIACVGGVFTTVKVNSGPTKVSKKFVKYLTSSWSYSDRYTWSKTNSASSTISTDVGLNAKDISAKLGVSHTVSSSYGTTVSIPASKSKLSKLAFYGDYNKRGVTVTKRVGTTTSKKTGTHYAPRKDTYLLVAYK
ncbi:hypothetical protein JCM21714_3162 [Gracilibacillus boraciitolerans JCM 21714]|uniref:Uncharacterized protein n=1 Tax=Gracilibacillus boraciitolerans JCM 21714 TaxID=1298598 RepID=W4VMI1_9BACI|nr:hypothetical protein [Gracilibacillus boraciitolerans]GAE94033.1 hypothetical protein JCM21714_3162 [Gracilibacillus boraciitolerans JCM 21714]